MCSATGNLGGPDSGTSKFKVPPRGGCTPPRIRASNARFIRLRLRSVAAKKFRRLMLLRRECLVLRWADAGLADPFNRAVFIDYRAVANERSGIKFGRLLVVFDWQFHLVFPPGRTVTAVSRYAWAKLLSFVAFPCQGRYLRIRRLLTERVYTYK